MASKNHPNSLVNLRPPWKPGESGNPNGRPPSRVEAWLSKPLGKRKAKKIEKLTKTELTEIDETLYSIGTEALKTIAQSKDIPCYITDIAMAILKDHRDGKTTTIDKIRERLHGKPVTKFEITGADGVPFLPPNQQPMTQEQAQEFLKALNDSL